MARSFLLTASCAAALAVPVPAAAAAPATVPESPNVTVGDIPLSGLTCEQAVERLESRVHRALMRKVVVQLGAR